MFRRLTFLDDEREEADLDLPCVRQSSQVRRPHGRWIFPGMKLFAFLLKERPAIATESDGDV